jgi:YidC/Oxa1 family membrane protein insertase
MNISKLFFGSEYKELKKFDSLSDSNRSIVFYAENKASMNHFELLISELTKKMDLEICYVTSVKNDPMLVTNNKKIKSFYIGDGTVRTKFFLSLKTKILVMDMPDLDRFHIKRSKTYPVHYVYLFHSMFSVHSYLREGALNNYDTIFCVGNHHVDEIREIEKVYDLKPKQLVHYGYGRLDSLLQEKNNFLEFDSEEKLILIAPSYGENNLLEICGIKLIDILLRANFKVLLRPHFRLFKDSSKLIDLLKKKFERNPNFILEEGVIPSELFFNSTCMISDWSGISLEYAFTLERKVIFIDTPQKILNRNINKISAEPIEISIREKVGNIVSPNDLDRIPSIIQNLFKNNQEIKQTIKELRMKIVYNIGNSAEVGARYIQELNNKLSS